MDTTTPQFERSPEFLVAEVAHKWLSEIERAHGDEIYMNKGRKIDPEKGILFEILEIRVARKMEKVEPGPANNLTES